jgi:hypothetical protein
MDDSRGDGLGAVENKMDVRMRLFSGDAVLPTSLEAS